MKLALRGSALKLASAACAASVVWGFLLFAYVTASPRECFGAIGGGAITACVTAWAERRAAIPALLLDPVGLVLVAVLLGALSVAVARWFIRRGMKRPIA